MIYVSEKMKYTVKKDIVLGPNYLEHRYKEYPVNLGLSMTQDNN